ncbi:class I SAM-dependent methyltransferase [Oscillatoria sp. CS-180]|uniref:class I SAM-dependent methyltransferase n=1 Tax=Oscillatoria sp. CS-180 TaxID=3021720 RepID=UPI00232E3BA1|nr:class I SAM-dependent methyltransferase [Oscillatoria sp. CS-180]MDB9525662.1 class I SAM-dependent methyltransferase [Oscillatoria sp. CS-180]
MLSQIKSSVRLLLVSLASLVLLSCQANGIINGSNLGGSVYQQRQPSHDGIGKIYLGREIAQVMGHEGAYWLERPSRELQEHPQSVVDLLTLDPTDVVADIGAGTGYMTVRLAEQVPNGKVFAVDVQPEMLALLNQRLQEQGITVIQPVQGDTDDPNLPSESVDLALMVDAYHEFEYPHEMMTHLKEAIKPGGQVVLAEYRAENPLILIKRLHKMSEKQVKRELQAVGFKWLKTDETLPQQHLLFFEKPA